MFAVLVLRSVLAVAVAAPAVEVQRPRGASEALVVDGRGYAGVDAVAAPVVVETPVIVPVQPVAITPVPITPASVDVEGPVDESEPFYDPMVDSPEAIRARHWVRGGIVFAVVGAVLTVGGIAMSTAKVNVPGEADQPCDNRGDRAGNGCTPGGRARAVMALAIPGALLLAGGVAMLAVGKVQQRRLRTSLQADKRGFMIGATLRF